MTEVIVGARSAEEGAVAGKPGEAVVAGGLRMQQIAEDLINHCRLAAREAGREVYIVFEDGHGNELATGRQPANALGFWLKAARGKIAALKAAGNEVERMNMGTVGGMPKLTLSLCSLTCCGKREFPVRGAAVVSYDDPEAPGKTLIGYLSVSGCPTPGGDVAIISRAMTRMPHTQSVGGKADTFQIVKAGDAEGFSKDDFARLAEKAPMCPPALVCSLVSILVVLMGFFCHFGHATGRDISPFLLISSESAIAVYWIALAVLLLRAPAASIGFRQKVFMSATVFFLFAFSICIVVHYIRYG